MQKTTKSFTFEFNKNIIKSLKVKIEIIEKDEKEDNLRKILNFGHTFGHAYEMLNSSLLHGEAVGKGMLKLLKGDLKEKVKDILLSLEVPFDYEVDFISAIELIKNDKKVNGEYLDLVILDGINNPKITKVSLKEIERILKEG